MSERRENWHVEKGIPAAMIVTLLLAGAGHTLVLVWFASNMWTRVADLEKRTETAAPQIERIIRLETKMDWITGTLTEIKTIVGRDRRPGGP